MGPLTWVLLLGTVNALGLAWLLVREPGGRVAPRLMAALLCLVALRLMIYVLGFAGAYDRHPALTFAPLDLSAGFAPLLWLYVRSLTGRWPARWWWHLVPAALQLGYQLACFGLPLGVKWDWYTGGHLHVVEPVAIMAILLLAGAYLHACWREQAAYQRWLDAHWTDSEPWRLDWLRQMLLAFGLLWAAVVGAALWSACVQPLDYSGRTPVMLGFCALAYGLGLLSWRHAGEQPPGWAEVLPAADALEAGQAVQPPEAVVDPLQPPAAERERVDYAAQAAAWMQRIDAGGWWREDGLTLGEVAQRLGVSERSLSRALNDGAGRSFHAAINGLRVAAIQQALAEPGESRELLTLALDHGFASKASFNRAFREQAGMTPSAWRRSIRQKAGLADFEAKPAAR